MQEDYTRQHKVHIFKKGARSRNRSNVLVIKLAQDWLACTRINTICEVFFRLSRPLLSGLFFDCESIADPEVCILHISDFSLVFHQLLTTLFPTCFTAQGMVTAPPSCALTLSGVRVKSKYGPEYSPVKRRPPSPPPLPASQAVPEFWATASMSSLSCVSKGVRVPMEKKGSPSRRSEGDWSVELLGELNNEFLSPSWNEVQDPKIKWELMEGIIGRTTSC